MQEPKPFYIFVADKGKWFPYNENIMKTLVSALNENIIFRIQTAPKFYKDRSDLLKPAKDVMSSDMLRRANEKIKSQSLLPKGHKYFMCDADLEYSLLVNETEGKRYSVTFSGHSSNDIFFTLKDFDHVIDLIKSMKINVDLFKSSKL